MSDSKDLEIKSVTPHGAARDKQSRPADITPSSLRVEAQSFTTRSLTVFEAVGGPLNRKYYFCRSKFPLAPGERVEFHERMERLSSLPLPALRVKNFGIDEIGFAYIITEQGNTKSLITKAPRPPEQVTKIVEEVIDILSSVHEAGLIIGDLSQDSFRLDSSNRVVFTSSLGFRSPAQSLESLGQDWVYLSPAEARGEKSSFAGDVFAAVALIYRLLTGRHYSTAPKARILSPQEFARVAKPSTVPHLVPEWADDFIAACLQNTEKDLPKSGTELKELFIKKAYPKAKFTVSLEKLYTAMLGVRTEVIRAVGFFVSFVTFTLFAIFLKQEGLLPQINFSRSTAPPQASKIDVSQTKAATEGVLGKLQIGTSNFSDRLAAANQVKTTEFELSPLGGVGDRTVDYIAKLRREALRGEQESGVITQETVAGSTDQTQSTQQGEVGTVGETPSPDGLLLLTFVDETGWWESLALGILYTWDVTPSSDFEIACTP